MKLRVQKTNDSTLLSYDIYGIGKTLFKGVEGERSLASII